MDIKTGRMVHLGYGAFWRSDEIVGLTPIQVNRGPGRRTEVFVSTREDPVVASRSETSILRDMVLMPDGEFEAETARELLQDLRDDLREITPVLRRMLHGEVGFDVDTWERRFASLLEPDTADGLDGQEDLFTAAF